MGQLSDKCTSISEMNSVHLVYLRKLVGLVCMFVLCRPCQHAWRPAFSLRVHRRMTTQNLIPMHFACYAHKSLKHYSSFPPCIDVLFVSLSLPSSYSSFSTATNATTSVSLIIVLYHNFTFAL